MPERSSVQQVYSVVLDRICLLKYPPHTLLREGELAREFGMSRTPIREVFLRLALMGLVASRNGVGTFVTGMDYLGYRDIYPLRMKVAELIGDLSPRSVTSRDIDRVVRLEERARGLQAAFDAREYWDLNHALHFTIGSLIGNSALRDLWDRYYYQTARIWYAIAERDAADTAESFVAEIEGTLRGLRADDLKAVGYVQRNGIAVTMRKVMEEVNPDTGEWLREPPRLTALRRTTG